MVDNALLLNQCAPEVSPPLMQALVRTESAWQPLAIGMDAGQGQVRQPQTLAQAVAQAKLLSSTGRQFSVGLAQIHVSNVARYGLTWAQAFDPCLNLRVGQDVLRGFYRRARLAGYAGAAAVEAALRGYNSGSLDHGGSAVYAHRIFGDATGNALGESAREGLVAPEGARASQAVPVTLSAARPEPSHKRASSNEAQEIFQKASTVQGF